ncbi:hypothetical protein DENSPDRAFT_885456, partial [Dentipellis sp. KUC8613]
MRARYPGLVSFVPFLPLHARPRPQRSSTHPGARCRPLNTRRRRTPAPSLPPSPPLSAPSTPHTRRRRAPPPSGALSAPQRTLSAPLRAVRAVHAVDAPLTRPTALCAVRCPLRPFPPPIAALSAAHCRPFRRPLPPFPPPSAALDRPPQPSTAHRSPPPPAASLCAPSARRTRPRRG